MGNNPESVFPDFPIQQVVKTTPRQHFVNFLLADSFKVAIRYISRTYCMPTILVIMGWRLFFYANEGDEPIHVHCRKGDMECKYWLDRDNFQLEEAFSFNMSSKDMRQIRQIIYEHFEYIEQQWDEFQRRRQE